jgi:hypothetical protein
VSVRGDHLVWVTRGRFGMELLRWAMAGHFWELGQYRSLLGQWAPGVIFDCRLFTNIVARINLQGKAQYQSNLNKRQVSDMPMFFACITVVNYGEGMGFGHKKKKKKKKKRLCHGLPQLQ